jgi:hypothetical protein
MTCLAACGVTVVLAYVPYIILGHGRAFGFLTTYVSERSWNGGCVLLATQWLSDHLQLNGVMAHVLGYAADLLLVGGVVLAIWWLRQRERISMEAGTLILIGTVFCVSTHVFPWYNTALLPWVALLVPRYPWTTGELSIKGLAIVMAWYFACASISAYFISRSSFWPIYYLCVYGPVLIGLSIAIFVGLRHMHTKGKV